MPKPPGHQLQNDGVFDEAGNLKPQARRYRKKPAVIEAFRLGYDDAPPWFFASIDGAYVQTPEGKVLEAQIRTLEGVMTGREGDWIIKGVKGELYPCKHDIFVETYEAESLGDLTDMLRTDYDQAFREAYQPKREEA